MEPPSRKIATRIPPRDGQRGSMAVTLLLLMLGLVAILGIVEVGYLYWAKRDAQKIADLAALAGAQRLNLCAEGNADNAAARANATVDNGFGLQGGRQLTITCGRWNPADATTADHFQPATVEMPVNAVKVVVMRPMVPLFGQAFREGSLTIEASAVATQSEPQVAFSIGSRLLGVNSAAPLQTILRLAGLDLSDTQLASYAGLASLQITPSGLLEALHVPVGTNLSVGDYQRLLAAHSITVTELLDAMIILADQRGLAGLDLTLLKNTINSVTAGTGQPLGQVKVNLLNQDDSPGLFASIAANADAPMAGLDARLNALDLLGAALSVADGRHAVTLQNVGLLGGVTAKASVIEPAAIAVGPVGTAAYNAQVRVNVDIDTNNIPAIGTLMGLLGTRVHVPLYIDAINAYATATEIDCGASPKTATFDVRAKVAGICLGKTSGAWASTLTPVDEMCQSASLIRLFGLDLAATHLAVPALADQQQLTVEEGDTGTTSPNSLAIGHTLSALKDASLDLLGDLLNPAASGNSPDNTAESLAQQYLEATKKDSGWYDPGAVVDLLRNGNGSLAALGSWQTDKVPVWCVEHLGLVPCLRTGDVWTGFNNVVKGDGGLLTGLTGLLGLSACNGLLTALTPTTYNTCVKDTLAYYLKTNPSGVQSAGNDYSSGTGIATCGTVLCLLLKPLTSVLRPILDAIGDIVSQLLARLLGLELGTTDVHVQAIQCHPAQLVY